MTIADPVFLDVCACVCVCVRVCVCARARVCVRASVRACVRISRVRVLMRPTTTTTLISARAIPLARFRAPYAKNLRNFARSSQLAQSLGSEPKLPASTKSLIVKLNNRLILPVQRCMRYYMLLQQVRVYLYARRCGVVLFLLYVCC
jgi:hypothetical protein